MEFYALAVFLGLIYGNAGQLTPPSPCGQSNFSPTPHAVPYIVGGEFASPGDFPWQVGLAQNNYFICGGSLVENSQGYLKIITAAHCVYARRLRPEDYQVSLGMHDMTKDSSYQMLQVQSIDIHQDYNDITMTNDIAVLGVGNVALKDLRNDIVASPICLPTKGHLDQEPSLVSGWGTTSTGGSSSQVLQYVWKPLLSRSECEKTNNGGDLDDTMLCSGEAGKDACQGDSGGPLVAYRGSQWELVGAVSWGYGCAQPNYPGVYANVFYLKSWIQTTIEKMTQ